MEITIEPAYHGLLLRTYLRNVLGLSSGLLSKMKRSPGAIMLNRCPVTVLAVLSAGDILSLSTECCDKKAAEECTVLPVELPLNILYEDQDILVCNKPAGMPTHPSHGHYNDTLANAVVFHWQERGSSSMVFRPINRLDRNTSGLVLVAANAIAATRLYGAMQRNQIKKTYLAILDGLPAQAMGRIERPIRRASDTVILREVCRDGDVGAQHSCTCYHTICHWTSKETGEQRALVMVAPITGRTHQLRVHFSAIGTPILGDELYGAGPSSEIHRHALHAACLSFPHPCDGQIRTFTAPLPPDMERVLPDAEKSGLTANILTNIGLCDFD